MSDAVTVRERLTTPVAASFDVIVCGGGPAGVAAAIAAARTGVSTLLLEVGGCLGGVWTSGLLSAVLDANKPETVLAEIIERLKSRRAYSHRSAHNFLYVPEQMKLVLEEMCMEAGVTMLLHTRVVAALTDERTIMHVVTESKSGRQAWTAPVFIDCTGDGDLAAFAGCRYDLGDDSGLMQPASLLAVVAGPDSEAVRPFWDHRVKDRKANLRREFGRAGFTPTYSDPTLFHLGGFLYALMANHQYGMPPDDAAAITHATLRARAEVHESIEALRSLPGPWQSLVLVSTADQIGVREGRRIVGRSAITADALAEGLHPPDSVATASFGMDLHSPDPSHSTAYDHRRRRPVRPYGLPYSAMVAADLDNLLLAGRCISGDFMAHSSYRVTGNATAMGQAAGQSAAYCARAGITPPELDWSRLSAGVRIDA